MRMVDKSLESGSEPQREPPARGSRGWRPWLLLAGLVLLAGGAVFARWRGPLQLPREAPLDGELIIAVRSAGGGKGNLLVEGPGALPVRAGGLMGVGVPFTPLALRPLVWLVCQG